MVNLNNIFELKSASSNQSNLYTTIAQMKASAPRYSEVKYKAIATEGYMRNWIISRCLQEIIRAAIQLDWVVKKYNTKGEPEEVRNHPVQQIIEKPNPLYGEAEFIKRAIAFYYIGGEAPLVKINAGNSAKEIYTYRPDKISFKSTGDVEQPYQDITYNASQMKDIMPEDFRLWKNFNPIDEWDGLGHGMSVLEPILKNGDLLNEMIDWNVSLLQNGGNLSGIVSVQETLDDKVYDRAKAELKINHQGVKNVGKYLLLEGGANFISTGTSPKDMDWVNGKDGTMKDICIGFGIDPIIIGFNENASYNNKREAEKGLYTKLVIPLMREFADQLGPFLGLQDDEYLEVDYSKVPVLQEDVKELNDRINSAKDLTINEKRKARGLEDIDGGDIIVPDGNFAIVDGKIYLPMNLVPLDEIGTSKSQNTPQGNQNKSMDFLY
jgi:HK97 family phage portal protein